MPAEVWPPLLLAATDTLPRRTQPLSMLWKLHTTTRNIDTAIRYTQWYSNTLHTVVQQYATHSGTAIRYTQWYSNMLHTVVQQYATHSGIAICYTQWYSNTLHTVVEQYATHSGIAIRYTQW